MWLRKPDWRHFSGIGAEPWIKEKQQAERMNSIAFLTLSTALVISIYGYAMHGAEGVQLLTGLLTGWMKNGVPYLP